MYEANVLADFEIVVLTPEQEHESAAARERNAARSPRALTLDQETEEEHDILDARTLLAILPKIPREALYGPLGEFAVIAAERSEATAQAIYITALTRLSVQVDLQLHCPAPTGRHPREGAQHRAHRQGALRELEARLRGAGC